MQILEWVLLSKKKKKILEWVLSLKCKEYVACFADSTFVATRSTVVVDVIYIMAFHICNIF